MQAWLTVRSPLEQQLRPLGEAGMARLDLRPGDRVLDIGCGIGGTPAALADRIRPGGRVIGIDLLAPAIDIVRAESGELHDVSFLRGDAQTHPFAPASFDAAFSRFGTMFFADPVAAFGNVRRALRPGGRLAFVCWRGFAENELDALPLRAAASCLPASLVREAAASAHFSFACSDHLEAMLAQAGFAGIDIRPHDAQVTSGSLQGMVGVCVRFGSLGQILRDNPMFHDAAEAALEQALRPRDGGGGPALRAATWLVRADAPA